MIVIFALTGATIFVSILLLLVQYMDREKLKSRTYKELTLFLGSGGHTG